MAQSSCEAEDIGATTAASEAKYIQALFRLAGGKYTYLFVPTALVPPLKWQADKAYNAFVIWMFSSCSCRQKLLPNVGESARYKDTRRDGHELHNMFLEVFTVLCVATPFKVWSNLDMPRV